MNEKKKLTVLVIVLALIAILISLMAYVGYQNNKKALKLFYDTINSSEKQIVYLGSPECHYCQQLEPIKKELLDDNKIPYTYFNTLKFSQSQLDMMINALKIKDFGTPYIVITQNGKVIDEQRGYVEKATMKKFLEDNGFLEKSK